MKNAHDYLSGCGTFARYNFFNILDPIGTQLQPLKDHPLKVGRLPRRHRKTPSSGGGAAPVISRKPRHFACIIHSNSSLHRTSRGDGKKQRGRDHFVLLFSVRIQLPHHRMGVPDFYSTGEQFPFLMTLQGVFFRRDKLLKFFTYSYLDCVLFWRLLIFVLWCCWL